MIKENEDDVKGEALHLLEAYMDAPYEILEENINKVPRQFLSEVGGAFRNSYIDLNEPRFNNDIFLDCYGIPYIRYTGANPGGIFREQLRELGWAANSIEDIKEFAGQDVCPVAEIGYYYQPDVYIGEDGTLYCVYEYKDEIGVFHTPAEILEDQLGNIYPVAVFRKK